MGTHLTLGIGSKCRTESKNYAVAVLLMLYNNSGAVGFLSSVLKQIISLIKQQMK